MSIYNRLVYWTCISTWWENASVFKPPQPHTQEATISTFNIRIQPLTYFLFVRERERERGNIEYLCGEILNQSSDVREIQTTRDSLEERWDDIDILLRERLAVFSATSKRNLIS